MKKEKPVSRKQCKCPYCEDDLFVAQFPFCKACGVAIQHCVTCKITVIDRTATRCPQCGGPLTKGGKKK